MHNTYIHEIGGEKDDNDEKCDFLDVIVFNR